MLLKVLQKIEAKKSVRIESLTLRLENCRVETSVEVQMLNKIKCLSPYLKKLRIET